jgi:hypothetical protein
VSTLVSTQSGRASRTMIVIAALAALALSIAFGLRPPTAAAFTPGENDHPTGGPYSDLKGGTATFTFEQNATLTCDSEDNASSFTFTVNYDVTGTLPAGATLVVYLSPNNGAIEGNSGGDDAGYIADVESNFFAKDVSGLTGTGSFEVTVPISVSFQLVSGGVLGVFASELGGQSWSSKTNSLNCTEAESAPPSVSESVPASAEQSVGASTEASASGEQSEKAGEGTPEESQTDSALALLGSSPLATIAFSLILLASLGALAYANVKTVRSRI